MTSELRVLLVGDAVGRPGREAIKAIVPALKHEGRVHFVIANAENSAHGKGITRDTAAQMFSAGADVLTAGNHTWDNKDVFNLIKDETRLIRPYNYSDAPQVPGRGSGVFEVPTHPGLKIAVVNLIGRVLMASADCPFRAADELIPRLQAETPIIFVDFHAEATSEKIAMGWHLNGRVTSITGTHTHVQTADETILDGGTAYMTDLGMTGGHHGVIGVKYPDVLHRFITGLPVKHEVATEDVLFCGAIVTVDTSTGRALNIERLRLRP